MFFTSTRPAWPRAAGLLNAAALAVLPAFAGQGRGRGLPPQPAQPVAGLVPGNQLPAPIQVPILQQLDPEFLASLAVVNLGVPEKIEAYREALRNGLQQQGAAEPPAPQMVPMPAPPGGNQVPAAAANQQELPLADAVTACYAQAAVAAAPLVFGIVFLPVADPVMAGALAEWRGQLLAALGQKVHERLLQVYQEEAGAAHANH